MIRHIRTVIVTSDINECLSQPCLNGGRCTDLINQHGCSCLPGFIGQICEIGKKTICQCYRDNHKETDGIQKKQIIMPLPYICFSPCINEQ